jgi:dUTP pyrophosphatase
MDPLKIKVKIVDSRAITPTQRDGDAGADLYAVENCVIQSGQVVKVRTGLAVEIPDGYEGQVRPRSGQASRGRMVVPPPPIDPGYRGEIHVIVHNAGSEWWPIKRGDRIAQLVIAPCPRVTYEASSELSETSRGADGFGSTGVNGLPRKAGNSG